MVNRQWLGVVNFTLSRWCKSENTESSADSVSEGAYNGLSSGVRPRRWKVGDNTATPQQKIYIYIDTTD